MQVYFHLQGAQRLSDGRRHDEDGRRGGTSSHPNRSSFPPSMTAREGIMRESSSESETIWYWFWILLTLVEFEVLSLTPRDGMSYVPYHAQEQYSKYSEENKSAVPTYTFG